MADEVALVLPPPTITGYGWNLAPGTHDLDIVELWLSYGDRSPHTVRAYRTEVARFLAYISLERHVGLRTAGLFDLYAYRDQLGGPPASRARALATVKSLFRFGHMVGYLPFDIGRAIKLPTSKDTLAQRILSEAEVHAMITLEPNPRNRRLIQLLYGAGLRVSELAALTWRDLNPRDGESGQVTVFGKRKKTRNVLLPAEHWRHLAASYEAGIVTDPDGPVFRSRQGKAQPLSVAQIERIVAAAGRRAGIRRKIGPHWLRHAHATHALERGAPIHLVAATLGHKSIASTDAYLHARPTDSSSRFLAL